MTIGIYLITNTSSGRVYIGSSIDVTKRMADHRLSLNHGKHHNKHLQEDWKQLGKAVFSFNLLEESDEDSLENKREYWINHYKSNGMTYNEKTRNRRPKDTNPRIESDVIPPDDTLYTIEEMEREMQENREIISQPFKQEGPYSKWKVSVNCSVCNCEVVIQRKTLLHQKKPSICRACRIDSRRRSAISLRAWKNKEFIDKVAKGRKTQDEKARRSNISNAQRHRFSNPESRKQISVAVKQALATKGNKISTAMKKKWRNPVWRERIVASQRKTAAEFWGFDAKKFKIDLDKAIDKIETEDS